ncbi:MAG TPA: LOG family protein [Candidatus Paceibacterota bacterium]|jgi:hypothetical protein|nr:LOG family protein [Candidatus Paceibacterota bacterium]
MNIAVFLSQYDVEAKYAAVVKDLAVRIAEGGHALVFGGGDEGLMHILAETVHQRGARVIAVIREPIKHKVYKEADEITVVEDEHKMNLGLIARADIIFVLAGGIGTLHELTALVRMKKNGQSNKGVVIVNTDGFYDGLKQQFERMEAEGFLRDDVAGSVRFVHTPEEAMQSIG